MALIGHVGSDPTIFGVRTLWVYLYPYPLRRAAVAFRFPSTIPSELFMRYLESGGCALNPYTFAVGQVQAACLPLKRPVQGLGSTVVVWGPGYATTLIMHKCACLGIARTSPAPVFQQLFSAAGAVRVAEHHGAARDGQRELHPLPCVHEVEQFGHSLCFERLGSVSGLIILG